MGVTHAFTNPKADGADATITRPSDWNATHSFDGQLAFPATQSPSAGANTLDDYEEGTWTPVLTFATPGDLSVTYSTQSGSYVKVSRLVFFRALMITSTFTHTTASGFLRITGLPFALGGTDNFQSMGSALMTGYTKANFTALAIEGGLVTQSLCYLMAYGSGQTATELTAADVPTATTKRVDISGHYIV